MKKLLKIKQFLHLLKASLESKKFLLLLILLIFQSCIITTHSVKEIKTSELNSPEDKSDYTSFKFSSSIKVQKTRDWFRNYFALESEDDLMNFKTSFLKGSDHEFIVTVFDYSDREQYMDLTGLFFGEGVESRESDIKFFVGITVTDKTGVDHLAESSIFQKPLLEQLTEMREEFRNFTVNNPDQKFF